MSTQPRGTDVVQYMIRSKELAWAAGVFDLSAHLVLYQRDRFMPNWSPRIVLRSDRELPVEEFKRVVGVGSVSRPHSRTFRWTVSGAKGCLEALDMLDSDRIVRFPGEREFRDYCELVRRPRPVRDRTLTEVECLERTAHFCDWMKARLRMPSNADPARVMGSIRSTGTLNSWVSSAAVTRSYVGTGIPPF